MTKNAVSIIIELIVLFSVKNRNIRTRVTKKEIIWREILFQCRQNKKIKFTQKELSQKFDFSISTVFSALKIPRESGAVRVTGRFFILENYKKLLYLWASETRLKKKIYYKGFINEGIGNLEGVMPPEVIFGLYSGFKNLYGKVPAEYDHLYIYLEKEKLSSALSRINLSGSETTYPNFFVLEPDKWFRQYPQPLFEQIFIDIWNASEWYAKDFLKALEEKLD